MTIQPWHLAEMFLKKNDYPLVKVYIAMGNHSLFIGKSTISMDHVDVQSMFIPENSLENYPTVI